MAVVSKTWAQFLEDTPPDTPVMVVNAVQEKWSSSSGRSISSGPQKYFVIPPTDIQLYCENSKCGSDRTFSFECTSGDVFLSRSEDSFVTYQCRNCRESTKTFAIYLPHDGNSNTVVATKYGENPPYGPPVPARVITLVGPDRELFLKGRRAELRGLGLGAFAYYRRVVENQTQRLFGELLEAARHLNDDNAVALLERAASQTQFTRAVELVKDALPQRLWIHGRNPLTLLHNALSNDLHAGTDEDCLEVAANIRILLAELAARVAEITKEDEGLRKAVAALANRPKK
jgi:hypothetical protein